MRIGVYKITATLSGFSTVTRDGRRDARRADEHDQPSDGAGDVSETVTVTGEAPLIETTTSSLGANIDPRQVSELPSQGRNWMSLALLAPGNRTNAQGALPVQDRGDVREFQLNVDGQQVTVEPGHRQPVALQQRLDRGVPVHLEPVRRDAGPVVRRAGERDHQVGHQPVCPARSSATSANSNFNAEDPVLKRVLPYSNQQISGTFGGPIVKNKLHFFANYEYERQPLTSIWNTPYPAFNVDAERHHETSSWPACASTSELSSKMRLMGKVHHSTLFEPFGPGTTNHPSATNSNEEHSTDVLGQFTQVLSNRALNELQSRLRVLRHQPGEPDAAGRTTGRRPTASPPTARTSRSAASRSTATTTCRATAIRTSYTVHDDFTLSYDAAGRHDLKVGGEYLHLLDNTRNCNQCGGVITANGRAGSGEHRGALPGCVQRRHLEPGGDLSTITTRYPVGVSDSSAFLTPIHMWKYGAWAQDDWKLSSNLTLNLGLRYDLIWNAFAQNVDFPPFEMPDRPQDANNLQPRVGFAYQITDRTVLRGGAGLYYNDILNTNVLWPMSPLTIAVIRSTTIRRGPTSRPTRSTDRCRPTTQALQRFCNVEQRCPGCLLRDLQEQAPISGLRARDAQLAELDRHRAAVRRRHGARSRLRATRAAATRSRSRTTSTSRSIPRPASRIRTPTSRIAPSRSTASSG